MATLNEIEKEILQLPSQERARLALKLIQNLDDEEQKESPNSDKLWAEEVKRRSEDLKQGKVKGIPAKKVFEKERSRMK